MVINAIPEIEDLFFRKIGTHDADRKEVGKEHIFLKAVSTE